MRFKVLLEAFSATKEIKLAGLENVFLNQFSNPSKIIAKNSSLINIISQIPRYTLEAISFGGLILVIIFYMLATDNITSVLPIIALYAFAGYRLMPAIQKIFTNITSLRISGPAINHLYNDHFCSYPQIGYDCEGNISEYVLGMEAEGGIVFYIDESGQHGLVAAREDIGPFAWGCQEINISNTNEQLIGTGLQNSLNISAQCLETPIASSESLDFENEGYTDWFLPSFDETQEMYFAIGQGASNGNKGEFSNSWYWTSSQANEDVAWSFSFSNGTTFNFFKTSAFMIRPIRAF